MSAVLHSASDVLSRRHGSSYLLLALAAGSVNAGAFLACESFVSHVSGTVTRLGLDAGAWVSMLEYTSVLVAFVLGATLSVLAIQARVYRQRRPLHALPLFAVSGLLVVTAWLGRLGAFGPIGGEIEERSDFVFLCVLALAMGLMNASVTTSTALAVRTTHMTGPATDFGVQLGIAALSAGQERTHALRLAALRGGKVVAFSLGALLMVPAVRTLGYLAFLVPAGLVSIATLVSFLPRRCEPGLRAPALSAAR